MPLSQEQNNGEIFYVHKWKELMLAKCMYHLKQLRISRGSMQFSLKQYHSSFFTEKNKTLNTHMEPQTP